MAIEPVPTELCWDIDPACSETEWDAYPEEVRERAAFLAVTTLRMLTAYRVGGCPITLRPCKASLCPPGYIGYRDSWSGGGAFHPVSINGVWYNGCGCSGPCGCRALCEIALPAPVGDLIEVKKDGVALPITDFRVDNGYLLVYEGSGDCPFDMEQDLNKPDTEVGTWSVTYLNAYKPTALASYAAGILAVEYAEACEGNECALPSGVTELVRAGVSMEITAGNFPGGFTGIKQVDTFIALYNPSGTQKQPPTVFTPRTPQYRHETLRGL